MLYPEQMAERKSEDKAVNTRLRRKMLDRWENEGGKVGETNANVDNGRAVSAGSRKQHTKNHGTNSK
jgi:hypothetical protein